MDDKHTPGLPARRTEKRLVKMASEALRGTAQTQSASAVRLPAQSKRLLRGALRPQILTTSSTILQRVPPVSRSTIANDSDIAFATRAQWCWAARPC